MVKEVKDIPPEPSGMGSSENSNDNPQKHTTRTSCHLYRRFEYERFNQNECRQ